MLTHCVCMKLAHAILSVSTHTQQIIHKYIYTHVCTRAQRLCGIFCALSYCLCTIASIQICNSAYLKPSSSSFLLSSVSHNHEIARSKIHNFMHLTSTMPALLLSNCSEDVMWEPPRVVHSRDSSSSSSSAFHIHGIRGMSSATTRTSIEKK
jgi:hypothetical protein